MDNFFIGVSALHHDSAAALIDEKGNIINISQEERRTKIKNDKSWPQDSIDWCLNDLRIQQPNVAASYKYGYYEKSWLKFTRQVWAGPLKWRKYYKDISIPEKHLYRPDRLTHHKSHALAATATAPFDYGMYLMVDAIGEWNSTTWGTFDQKNPLRQLGSINYPHSLGLLYSAFTRWLGLKPNEDEYIVMGAAAYGKPVFSEQIFNDFIIIKYFANY